MVDLLYSDEPLLQLAAVRRIETVTKKPILTNCANMFEKLTDLPLIPAMNTSNVTNMCYMFFYCQEIDTIPPMDTSRVVDMHSMFSACMSLKNIPEINTSNVTNMDSMFEGCMSLESVPVMDLRSITNLENVYCMFKSCPNIKQVTFRNCRFSKEELSKMARLPIEKIVFE